ncbi:MAG: hypothetical protein HZA61_08470 [Candidatus Eisenbacteria bacterium]|uniref:Outer membrane lipoprotein carrier protein LolA n=1 Tax=Eiseniibacteriota bacterium TaxID=2212470 RepID=A0A933SCE1_UNCEI|nr:hypothetical protein [Candidatus Eisenbacteria bacterium]
MTHRRSFVLVLVLALVAAAATAVPARALESSRVLERELGSSGRAEAHLRYATAGMGGGARTVNALLALELPERARLDVTSTGEKIVTRPDGGEWLQPSLRQMLKFRPQQAAAALRWWKVLLGDDSRARERRTGEHTYVVTLLGPGGAPEDSAEVTLNSRGLPLRLAAPAGSPDAQVYRLEGWRFMRPRGPAGFKLAAPAGYEVVSLP